MSGTTSSATGRVFGRDVDRTKIVNMLREAAGDGEPGSSNYPCYSTTIGIYGIAGSGKTILAQYVCEYEKEDGHFSPVMWVDVSQSFSVDKIYRQMLEGAIGRPSYKYQNLDALENKLKAELRDKRFLLALDGLQSDVAQQERDQVRNTLNFGKRGSKILVTALSKDAAMSLGAKSPVEISEMDDNDFLDLFMHYALDGVRVLDSQKLQKLHSIGRGIANKLRRLPVAARRVGDRLCKNLDASSWQKIRDNEVPCTDIIQEQWRSYQKLNEQVRRCFAYCSMFPRNYRFKRNALVKLWMAEGFIKTSNGQKMEDIGEKYFEDLKSWSFIKSEGKLADSDDEWFTIPDMLHELAEMVAGNDCLRVLGDEVEVFRSDVRHLFITSSNAMKYKHDIYKMKKLRTLIISADGSRGITEQVLERMLKELKKLRVVQTYLDQDRVIVPESACGLKHLRFLSILGSHIRQVKLSTEFGKLYHLQTLEFPLSYYLDLNCSNVKRMSSQLINLRSISSPYVDLGIPYVEDLKQLQELSHFKVRKEEAYRLKQLMKQNNLRGSLKISGLESVESKEKALEANLTEKKCLTTLSLEWHAYHASYVKADKDLQLQVEILDGLQPPEQLTCLNICHYLGRTTPSWLSRKHGGVSNLQFLELRECYNLETLPEIAKLFTDLRKLRLNVLPNLTRLPRLPGMLKSLEISGCRRLEVTSMDDQRLFPASLECLHLTGCTVEDTVLRDSLRGCTVLGSLKLSQIDSFTEIPSETMRSLVRLRDLYIGGCKQLVRLEGLNHLDSLEHLTIIKCPSLMDLKVAGKAHAVPRLTVDDMSLVPKLLSRGAYPSLKWLALEHSVELRGEWILEHLTSLAYLGFTSCHWNSLPNNLENLTALKELYFDFCGSIRSLPKLPKSLLYFRSIGCKFLFLGSNWDDIARIPYRRIL